MPENDETAVAAQIAGLADQLQAEAQPKKAMDDLAVRDLEQDIRLKNQYAVGLLLILGAQMIATDVLVYFYAALGRDWDIPSGVIQGWLAATVVQLIGVVLVVTRYLFPRRDLSSDSN